MESWITKCRDGTADVLCLLNKKTIERRHSLLSKLFLPNYIDNINSWSHLVKPNTEELISQPLLDENSMF